MSTSMKDVAKKAGVSTATVSHVINNTRFVKQETRQKVLKAMNDLNYHPNYAARSLRSQKSHIIGLLIPDISNFFFTGIARGIENILRQNGYNLILSNSDEKFEIEKEQLRIFKAQQIDGLIMAPAADNKGSLQEEIANIDCPVIFIDRKPSRINGDCVLVENKKGSYEAVKYLLKKGHKKIGIITGLPGLTTTDERFEGYKKALEDNGLSVNDDYIKIGNSRYESGYKLTEKLVKETDITALFLENNLMSIGAMELLKDKGIKIPEEIAIIGFDDYEWASITAPPLSVVKQPITKIGHKAAKILLNKLDGSSKDCKDYRLPTELVIRNSC